MFTIRPRAVSRVCRIALNCTSNWARSWALSASACALSPSARSRSAFAAAICASLSLFTRSASFCAVSACASFSAFKAIRLILCGHCLRLVVPLQAVRLVLGRHGIRASLSRFKRSLSAWAAAHLRIMVTGDALRRPPVLRAAPFRLRRATRSVSDCAAARAFSARRFTLRSGLALVGQLLFADLLDGDDAGVLRHLDGLAGNSPNRLAAGLAFQIAFSVLQPSTAFWKVSAA